MPIYRAIAWPRGESLVQSILLDIVETEKLRLFAFVGVAAPLPAGAAELDPEPVDDEDTHGDWPRLQGCRRPDVSPHDLRHRRISLLHRQGRTWAEIGRLVGQRKLSVTADTYTHVLSDGAEISLEQLLAR